MTTFYFFSPKSGVCNLLSVPSPVTPLVNHLTLFLMFMIMGKTSLKSVGFFFDESESECEAKDHMVVIRFVNEKTLLYVLKALKELFYIDVISYKRFLL